MSRALHTLSPPSTKRAKGGRRQEGGRKNPAEQKRLTSSQFRALTLLGDGVAETGLLGKHAGLALLEVEPLAAEALLLGGLLRLLLVELGVLADGLVSLGVDLLKVVGLDPLLDVAGELNLEALLVLLLEALHVLSDMTAEDVLAEDVGVELTGLAVETDEALLGVRHGDATVADTLEGAEDAGAGGGAVETDIKESLEGTGTLAGGADVVVLTSGADTSVALVELEGLEETTRKEEASGVGSGVVGETKLDPVAGELVRVGGGHDNITSDLRVGDLADDVAVGETDDEPVLVGVVLVDVLDHELSAGGVVGLALTTTTVLGLEALEVSFVLDEFLERHF